ncbi:tRNA adenosine(34) deaminase TadA [Enterococcus sp.]|uniref:tRNA adenosine(34) deaminase TadA n=1 Tax=Enterococcus sp. TaxID=35783 RepID=UPI002FCB9C50
MEKISTLTIEEKEYFMKEAIKEAKKAELIAEVPIGAVVVLNGEIIGRGHNLRETSQNATAHAEMMAIQQACARLDNFRLEDTQLFVTLEPCPMCSGAILLSRIDEVYFGAYDPKGGAAGSLLNLLEDQRFNHWCYLESRVLEEECSQLLKTFFKALRQRKKADKQKEKENSEKD